MTRPFADEGETNLQFKEIMRALVRIELALVTTANDTKGSLIAEAADRSMVAEKLDIRIGRLEGWRNYIAGAIAIIVGAAASGPFWITHFVK